MRLKAEEIHKREEKKPVLLEFHMREEGKNDESSLKPPRVKKKKMQVLLKV